MRKPLSNFQIACLIVLWAVLCYIVIITAKQIDGPVILSIVVSGALVFVPLYKSFKKNK